MWTTQDRRTQLPRRTLPQTLPATTRRLPLHVNFAWQLAGNVVYAGCGWTLVMAIAKLGSAEQVGQYSLGLAVIGPVLAFSMLNLRAVQATDAVGRFPFGLYFALRLVTNAVALLVIVAIALFHDDSWTTTNVIVASGIAGLL